jgi:hypothetical protein
MVIAFLREAVAVSRTRAAEVRTGALKAGPTATGAADPGRISSQFYSFYFFTSNLGVP